MGHQYEELRVWQEAIALAKSTYAHTESFPKQEMFGLTSQMRRAAVSIASNIAEGAARNSPKEFSHFIGISLGSLAELDTQCVVATGLFLSDAAALQLRASIKELRKMLSGLQTRVKASHSKP